MTTYEKSRERSFKREISKFSGFKRKRVEKIEDFLKFTSFSISGMIEFISIFNIR